MTLTQTANRRAISESERRIRGIVCGLGDDVLQDSQLAFQRVRGAGLLYPQSQVEVVLESIRQERFARDVGEPEFLLNLFPKPTESKEVPAPEKESAMPVKMDKFEKARLKRVFMIKKWKKDPTIPKDTMKKMVKSRFKKAVAWDVLGDCRNRALAELKGKKPKAAARKNGAQKNSTPKKAAKIGRPKGTTKKTATKKTPRKTSKPRVKKFYRNSNALPQVLDALKPIMNLKGVKVNISICVE